MSLLTDTDRAECDDLGNAIRARITSDEEADRAPVSADEAVGWCEALIWIVVGTIVSCILYALTALAVGPHI